MPDGGEIGAGRREKTLVLSPLGSDRDAFRVVLIVVCRQGLLVGESTQLAFQRVHALGRGGTLLSEQQVLAVAWPYGHVPVRLT